MLPLTILGMSFSEIAEATGISNSTVQYYIDMLTEKGHIIDRTLITEQLFNGSADIKPRRRRSRSSVLTSKGAAYMLAIGAKIEEGTPIVVLDN